MIDIFTHLNNSDDRLGPEVAELALDLPRRRVLHRLGEYVEMIVRPLNMRPRAATLVYENAARVEVRVSTETTHVLVVIAPEGDLASELFFMRMLGGKQLPIPRLIAADMSCAMVPFSYIIQGHIAGAPLQTIAESALVRVAARQAGRVLRQAHALPAPGFGKPTPSGRWTTRAWASILSDWLNRRGTRSIAVDVLGEALAGELWSATLDHHGLDWFEPRVIHGTPEPAKVIVTVGNAAHLEALIRPGEIVGGDPLFDLALATLPRHPAAFQQGIYEGYIAAGTLSPTQHDRLQRLRLLLHTADVLVQQNEVALARLPGIVADALRQLEKPEAKSQPE